MFGSKMMSSGGEADLLGEEPVGPATDRDLPLGGVGLALLVEGHDDHRGAIAPHQRGLAEELASPSLRLIEFTTPFPWTHLRPASMTAHLDESIITGTRLMPARRRGG